MAYNNNNNNNTQNPGIQNGFRQFNYNTIQTHQQQQQPPPSNPLFYPPQNNLEKNVNNTNNSTKQLLGSNSNLSNDVSNNMLLNGPNNLKNSTQQMMGSQPMLNPPQLHPVINSNLQQPLPPPPPSIHNSNKTTTSSAINNLIPSMNNINLGPPTSMMSSQFKTNKIDQQVQGGGLSNQMKTPPYPNMNYQQNCINQPPGMPPLPQTANSVPPQYITPPTSHATPYRPYNTQSQQVQPNQQQQYLGNQTNSMYSNTPPGIPPTIPNQMPMQYQNRENNVAHSDFNRLWGYPDTIDLMQNRHILPPEGVQPTKIMLNNQFSDSINCDPKIFRCTLAKIPESNNLLQKSRLPLGVLIHPFRDLSNLPVVSCSQIVRCRACRTYINPFVHFVDSKKWKCNLCYRINELPDEFQYDPVTKTYGDVTRRPEVRSSTIEFIAPSEYMLRPPQPAIYLFLLDVSLLAVQSGYLSLVCDSLAEHLDNFPGDARTQVGFITYNSHLHFYNIAEGYNRPHEITIVDLDDVFLPRPDNLLINLKEHRELINDLLDMLPKRFEGTYDNGSALGAALQVAFKMMSATGGRVTIFQTCLPNKGPGALQSREDPNNRVTKDVQHLGPATDFYKRLALDFSGQQIAADLFLLNSQYCDLATLSGISKFSGGCIYHFPLFNAVKKQDCVVFRKTFERYLTRKIGFEAVMRVRCTRGLQIHTFHGNFFVRSTDLLSLPNVNPDAGYGMQISYDENISDVRTVCFQAALLYTSSKGERRIRVHTLCLPVVSSLVEVINSADVQCIIGLLSKMAVDRSIQASLTDAREAFINATIDILSAFKLTQNLPSTGGQLLAPKNLSTLPLFILAILKNIAFRTGVSTKLDDRVFAMCELKTLPLDQLMRFIYPDFYRIDCLFENNENNLPPKHQLSAEILDSRSMYLMDLGTKIIIYIGSNIPQNILQNVIGVQHVNEIPDICFDLQVLENEENKRLHDFIEILNEEKPFPAMNQLIRDTSTSRALFIERLVDDRTESSFSYYEFLQHLRTQVK